MDHDQRLKALLKAFFPEFVRLFFPDWAERLDFATLEWLEKEFFADPPTGGRRQVDLLARVRATVPPVESSPAELLALVHVEVESEDKAAPLRGRMLGYYDVVRRLGLPVLPIAVFLRVGLDGLGWDTYVETFWGHELVRFNYAYVGLPALDGEAYSKGENWLGVALSSLMKLPRGRRAEVGREALRRLLQCPEPPQRRYLLCECLDAYLPLDEQERDEYERKLVNDPDPGVRTMVMPLFEKIRQEGRQEGLLEGKRELLMELLHERFGPLPSHVNAHVQGLSAEQLKHLTRAVVKAQSLADLGLGP